MIKSRNVFFPALKATSFVMIKISLTNTGQPEKRREKKWKDVKNNCFNVKPIEEIDFVRMSNSLKTDIGKVVEQKFLNNNEQADLLLR